MSQLAEDAGAKTVGSFGNAKKRRCSSPARLGSKAARAGTCIPTLVDEVDQESLGLVGRIAGYNRDMRRRLYFSADLGGQVRFVGVSEECAD
jgi:hypothetical protein